MGRTSSKPAFDWDDKAAVAKLKKLASYLSADSLAKANAAALNRAGKKAGSVWRKESVADVTAPEGKITSAFKDKKAIPGDGVYTLTVLGSKTLKLKEFSDMVQTETGVSVKIWKNGTSSNIRGAFIVDKFGVNAFIRRGSQRGPLKTLYGPSPKDIAQTKQARPEAAFNETYRKRIVAEIEGRVKIANR
jgi:hypothetical protein